MVDKVGSAASKMKDAKKAKDNAGKAGKLGKEALNKGASYGAAGGSQLAGSGGQIGADNSNMNSVEDFQSNDTITNANKEGDDLANQQSEQGKNKAKEAGNEAKNKAQNEGYKAFKNNFGKEAAGGAKDGATAGNGATGASGTGSGGSSAGGSSAAGSSTAGGTGSSAGGTAAGGSAGASGGAASGGGTATGGVAAAESNPVGWTITIVVLVILAIFLIFGLLSNIDIEVPEDAIDTQSYNFVTNTNDIITDDTGKVDVNSIEIENKLYMTYFQYIANQGLYYTVTDLDGKTYNLEQGDSEDTVCSSDKSFNGKCRPEDKEGKDENLELDYLQLIYLNDLIFGDYIYPQQLVKPVYNTCGNKNLSDSDEAEECKTKSLTNSDEELVAESSKFTATGEAGDNTYKRSDETTKSVTDWGFAPIINYQEGEEYDYWQDKHIETIELSNVYPMVGSKACNGAGDDVCAEYPVAITDGGANATITISLSDGFSSKDELASAIFTAEGSGYSEDAAADYANKLWNNDKGFSLETEAGGNEAGREEDPQVSESLTTEYKYLVSSIATYMGNASNSIVEKETNNGEREYGETLTNSDTYTIDEEDLGLYDINSEDVEKTYSLGEINTNKGLDENSEPYYTDSSETVNGYDWNYTCSQDITYTYEGDYTYKYFDEGLDSFETSTVSKTETETETINNCSDSPSFNIGDSKTYQYTNPETGEVDDVELKVKKMDITYNHNTDILDNSGNVIKSYDNMYVTGGTAEVTTTLNSDLSGTYTMYRHEIRYAEDGLEIEPIDYYVEDYALNADSLYINEDYVLTKDEMKYYDDLTGQLCSPDAALDMSANIDSDGEVNYDGLECDALASVYEAFEYDSSDQFDTDKSKTDEDTGGDYEFGTNNEDSNTESDSLVPGMDYTYAEAWDYTQIYANQFGIDPYLLWALFGQESGWRMVESAGGIGYGIGQLTLSEFSDNNIKVYDHNTGSYVTIKSGTTGNNEGTSANIMTLEGNIKVSAAYLATKLETFEYNIPIAIQSYNFGDGGVRTMVAMQISYEDNGSFDNWESVSDKEIDDYIKSGSTSWIDSGATEATSEYYGKGSTWGDPDYVKNVAKYYYGDTEPYAYDKKGNQHTISGNNVDVNKIKNQSNSVEEMIKNISEKDFFTDDNVSNDACKNNTAYADNASCEKYNESDADNNFEYLYGVDIDSVQTEFNVWEKFINEDVDDSEYMQFTTSIDKEEVSQMEDILFATMENVSLEEYQLFPLDPAFILYSFFADSGYNESYETLLGEAVPADNISLITGDICLSTSTPMPGREGLVVAVNAGETELKALNDSYGKNNDDGKVDETVNADGLANIQKVYDSLLKAVNEGKTALESSATTDEEFLEFSQSIYDELDKFKDECNTEDIVISRDFGKNSDGEYENNVQILQRGGSTEDEEGKNIEIGNTEVVMSLADGIAIKSQDDTVTLFHGYDVENGEITPIVTKYINIGDATQLPTLTTYEEDVMYNAVVQHVNNTLSDKAERDQDATYSINDMAEWDETKDLNLSDKITPGGTVLGAGEMNEVGDEDSQSTIKTYNFEFYYERWGHAQDPTFIINALNNSPVYNQGLSDSGSSGEESFTGIGNADISVDWDTFMESEGCGPEWNKYKSSGTKFVFGEDCGELEAVTEDDFGRPIGDQEGFLGTITAMAYYPGGSPHMSGSAAGTAVDMDYIGAAQGAGMDVYPVADGKLVSNFQDSAGANGSAVIHLVCDNSGNNCSNYVSFYLHFQDDSFHQKEGDEVTTKDPLANEGSTGNSTGDHVHLEIAKDSLVPGWYNPGKAMPAQDVANLIGVPGGYGATWFSRTKD